MTLWGIDISNHQAGADLARAKAAGCAFAFLKATEGGTYRDPYFAGFQAQAHSLGMPSGAYHFARPGNGRTGAQEAAFFLSVAGLRLGELPPVLDLEDTKLSSAATVAWALDFLQTAHRATGVRPILYTYTAFAQAHLGAGAGLGAYPLWLANYRTSTAPQPSAPAPWSSWAAWQHTSTAQVPGIPGSCDRNITNLTLPELLALGRNTTSQEDELMAITVKDPTTGKQLPLEVALSSMLGHTAAAHRDASAALAIAKAQAAAAKPLTAAQIDDIAKATVAALGQDYDASVTLTPKAGA